MWVYRLGPERAKRMLFTGDRIDGREAERLGLVYKVFPDETFRADAAALAGRLAAGPALAHRLTKQALAASLANGLEAQLAVEAELQGVAGFSEDFAEGVRAFREKRAPRFQGR
jgi:2-(1,2-epoxy-1,2-dihydrophenyl)acetyl-CoA isomerase